MFLSWFKTPFRNPQVGAPADADGTRVTACGTDATVTVNDPTRPDDDGHGSTTFRQLCAKYSRLAPRDASVGAFLVWLQEIEECWYSWEQRELFDYYDTQCRLTRAEPMPWRFFGAALDAHGCHRWRQECVAEDGRRRRVMFVRIPEVPIEIKSHPKPQPYKAGKGLRVVSRDPSHYPSRLVGRGASPAFAA